MKKLLSIILSLTLVTALLTSCGEKTKSYNIADVMTTIEAAAGIMEAAEVSQDNFLLETGIAADDVEDFAGKVTNVNGASGTIYIVKAKAGKASDIKAKFEEIRLGTADFLANYPEFASAKALAESGIVASHGDYVILVISGDAETAESQSVEKAYEPLNLAIDEAFK